MLHLQYIIKQLKAQLSKKIKKLYFHKEAKLSKPNSCAYMRTNNIDRIIIISQSKLKMNIQSEAIQLDGNSLTLETLQEIVGQRKKIDLSSSAWKIVDRSRQAIKNMMQDKTKAVYGITTGFGSFANVSISIQNRKLLQLNLIRSHSVCVGEPVSLDIVRRMYILRINTLAKGRSGINPQNLKKMIQAYNSDFLPMVPSQGTVGASGDLAPLSHLALGLLGQGLAWDHQQQKYVPSAKMLTKLGLTKLQLEQKEGLALINGTQFIASILSQAICKAQALYQSSLILYSLAVQIFGVDRNLFTLQSQQFYKLIDVGLSQIIKNVRKYIGENESQLHKDRQSNQQIHSLLDFPQALAGINKIIQTCKQTLQNQMNSATDNPLVYFKQDGFDEDVLISAGNFHGEYPAKIADFLGVVIFELGKFSQSRIQRYVNGKISKLSPFLIKNGGLNSGFMITQYTTAALLSESKVLVKPASIDSIVTSAGQEDHVSMGGFAARKADLLANNIANICAIELLLAFNAIEQLQRQTSPQLTCILKGIKKLIHPLVEDRFFGPDLVIAKQLILRKINVF